jgi:hypothetical protein
MTRIGIAAVGLCLISPVIASLHSSELSAAPAATSQGNGHFSFALIGDMPYGSEGDAKFPNIITEINADRSLAFVVHDGDFKNGSSVCSDEVFQNRLTLFNRFRRFSAVTRVSQPEGRYRSAAAAVVVADRTPIDVDSGA